MIPLSEAALSLGARNVQKCLKRCYIDYEIQLWILLFLLGTNRKHKSKSFVPDVRTKRYGYLISIRDTCFECETLVSLPRWALHLLCTIAVRLLYACSSQMGPRWSSFFCLEETEVFGGFLYFKPRVILKEEKGNTRGPCLASLGSRRQEEGREKSAWCFLCLYHHEPLTRVHSSLKCQFRSQKLALDSTY